MSTWRGRSVSSPAFGDGGQVGRRWSGASGVRPPRLGVGPAFLITFLPVGFMVLGVLFLYDADRAAAEPERSADGRFS
jgi:hypothetical protein